MTSPLLEWTYPKRLIRLDVIEPETEIGIAEVAEPAYRVLVPVANLNTQKGLIQLAAAIALNDVQSGVVHPLSLVELEEDYAFQSLPAEADRLMADRRSQLEELIQTLEPADIRDRIQPLVSVTNDVARETSQIATLKKADLMLVGWHRPAFSTNRLGGRVGQFLSMVPVDVAVYVDRGQELLEKLLVPYSGNIHDDLALELALRLLVSFDSRSLTILRVVQAGETNSELSYELSDVMQNLSRKMRDRIDVQIQEAAEPIQAAVEASARVDLTIAGTSRAWGIERQTLGRYTDQLANQCRSSLLITRRYSQVTSHLVSVLAQPKESADISDDSGVQA